MSRKGPISIKDIAAKTPARSSRSTDHSDNSAKGAYKYITKYTRKPPANVRETSGKIKDIDMLSGFQEKVFNYIFTRSKRDGSRNSDGSLVSPKISASDITKNVTGTDVKKSRDVIRELKEGKVLGIHSFKQGPGGWTRYTIPNAVVKRQAALS